MSKDDVTPVVETDSYGNYIEGIIKSITKVDSKLKVKLKIGEFSNGKDKTIMILLSLSDINKLEKIKGKNIYDLKGEKIPIKKR